MREHKVTFFFFCLLVFVFLIFIGRLLVAKNFWESVENKTKINRFELSWEIWDLQVTGELGQILFFPFYLKDEESIRRTLKYSNIVVNLIGTRYQTSNFSFADTHVDGARRLARIAREMGVERLCFFLLMKKCISFLFFSYFGILLKFQFL